MRKEYLPLSTEFTTIELLASSVTLIFKSEAFSTGKELSVKLQMASEPTLYLTIPFGVVNEGDWLFATYFKIPY